jgi:hypothetical protein
MNDFPGPDAAAMAQVLARVVDFVSEEREKALCLPAGLHG